MSKEAINNLVEKEIKIIPEALRHPEKLFNNEIKKTSLEGLIRKVLEKLGN